MLGYLFRVFFGGAVFADPNLSYDLTKQRQKPRLGLQLFQTVGNSGFELRLIHTKIFVAPAAMVVAKVLP